MEDYYASVRSLIYDGGLFRSFTSKEHNLYLKLRNPTQKDIDWIFECSPFNLRVRETALISKCVYSINGRVLKGGETLEELLVLVSSISKPVNRRLLLCLNTLIEKSQSAFDYLEAFSYEDESRSIWLSWQAKSNLGIRFLDDLSDLQAHWVVWNQIEDERKKVRVDWEQALLVTSSMNSKGAKSIRDNWEVEDKKIESYRKDLMKSARSGKMDKAEIRRLKNKKNNFQDLQEEYKRWLSGDEDEHDRIVREYKDSMYRKIEDDKRRAEEARERNRKRREDIHTLRNSSSISTPVTALTDADVARLSSAKKFKETNEHEERFEHVKERYILAQEVSPNVSIDENGNLVSKVPKKKSLMEQISNRTPRLED